MQANIFATVVTAVILISLFVGYCLADRDQRRAELLRNDIRLSASSPKFIIKYTVTEPLHYFALPGNRGVFKKGYCYETSTPKQIR